MTIVQRADEDDWARLRDVRIAALQDAPDAFGASLTRELGFGERHWRMRLRGSPWWLASVEAPGGGMQDVGLVGLIEEPGAPPDARHVVSMWVAPEHRRAGAGSALLEAVLAHATADRASRVTLWLVEGNVAGAELYQRHGFVQTGERTALVRDPSRTEERWECRLGIARAGGGSTILT